MINRLASVLVLFLTCILQVKAQEKTSFSAGAGRYSWMLNALEQRMTSEKGIKIVKFGGRERTEFVQWIRDHVHVMKAMKYIHPDMTSFLEFYMERQTPEGIYYDYYYPLNIRGISKRKNLFDQKYWKEYPEDSIEMHRLPVEADLEYLIVEGVFAVYQSTGDTAFVRKWLPSLERGINYMMTDSLRWSVKYGLVKRGYTLDTWDFMQLPLPRKEYVEEGGDVQKGIFNIDASTPMGIMHGDNSGLYAATRQLSYLNELVGNKAKAVQWNQTATDIRKRANDKLWNGAYYKHFLPDDPQPAYLLMDQAHVISLSNPYDVNRGLPTDAMAQSIVGAYQYLKTSTADSSFAEWYGIYPAVVPHFADYLPGSYMNGGVNTIVAGELAKAALQHGYEQYGVDILHRIDSLMQKYNGDLPVSFTPEGKVDEGIPDNWGQAAVYSALIEGLAGVVDKGRLFNKIELSPRWIAAGVDSVNVNLKYPAGGGSFQYSFRHEEAQKHITLNIRGNVAECLLDLLIPYGAEPVKLEVNGKRVKFQKRKVRESVYARYKMINAGGAEIGLSYK
ncbi:hypothetical protein [Pollutibacter soli]|uniref:hypothetical protein n=1 Tax=Pollutibacter soli TaxID=3034157 RepID=UPI0030138EF0